MLIHRLTLSSVALVVACAPSLDLTDRPCGSEAAPEASPVTVRPDPSAALDGVSPATRFSILATPTPTLETMALVEGHVGSGHLSQLERGAPSGALRERIVPALTYQDEAGTTWLHPTEGLLPGVDYTVAVGSHETTVAITAVEDPSVRAFVFPPDGAGAGTIFGVWCGHDPTGRLPPMVELAPRGRLAMVTRGAVGLGRKCLTVTAETSTGPSTPVAVEALQLQPAALTADAQRVPAAAVACDPGDVPVGPGCLTVFDDRARLRSPAEPLLWSIESAGLEETLVLDGGSAWVLPLAPLSKTDLTIGWTAIDGASEQLHLTVETASPMPHLVITEVLANPYGPEPQQEWVEVTNDGLAPAALGGWVLRDVGGEIPLPSRMLPAGATLVLVRDDFDPSLDYDPPVPDEVRVAVGPALGTNGLSNAGEPLDLIDPSGRRVSRFPAHPKPKAGLSVARRSPRTADDDPEGFVRVEPTPGSVDP